MAKVLPVQPGLEWVSYNSLFEVLQKKFCSVIGNHESLLPSAPGVESLEIFNTWGEALSE